MQLEDYFDFSTVETKFGPVECIRIKGHRIGIEFVVDCFKEGFSPETVLRDIYPSLSLEKIYATILYYLANKEKVEEYIRRGREIGDQYYQEYLQQPESEAMKRMKALMAEKEARKRQSPNQESISPVPAEPIVP